MVGIRRLLWQAIGKFAAEREGVAVRKLAVMQPQSRTRKIHIPSVHELPQPGVTTAPVPLTAGQYRVQSRIGFPEVHGTLLGDRLSREDEADDESTSRLSNTPATNGDQADREPPYLSSDLLALLLPPASDLADVTLEWPADLYPFQVEGIKFLLHRRHALLADDMGLGKTVQTIAAIRILLKAGWIRKALIVCPASIKTNWLAEFNKWAPELSCELVQGDAQDRKFCWGYPCHVLITNYSSLIRDYGYGHCDSKSFDIVVLDEAQKIKNSNTKTARTTKALKRTSSWCLTGTPIENSADDMRSIFGFVNPDLQLQDTSSSELRMKIEPYFLRRRKQEVLQELPPKRVNDRWLSLTPAQQVAYDKAQTEGVAYLRELGHQISITHVLALITRLKQICNFDPKTERSCKLEYLKESLEEIAAAGEKTLVFSQFTQTLDFLHTELTSVSTVLYDGSMSVSQKDAARVAFTEDPACNVMLVSLKAGGLGLNLQAASWVFHYDRWWTPAAERQAEDRAHRIGQRKALMIERLMCEGTIEERIHQIQQRKQRIIDDIVEADYEDGVERLSTEEMFEVIGLEPELAEIAKRRSH